MPFTALCLALCRRQTKHLLVIKSAATSNAQWSLENQASSARYGLLTGGYASNASDATHNVDPYPCVHPPPAGAAAQKEAWRKTEVAALSGKGKLCAIPRMRLLWRSQTAPGGCEDLCSLIRVFIHNQTTSDLPVIVGNCLLSKCKDEKRYSSHDCSQQAPEKLGHILKTAHCARRAMNNAACSAESVSGCQRG